MKVIGLGNISEAIREDREMDLKKTACDEAIRSGDVDMVERFIRQAV